MDWCVDLRVAGAAYSAERQVVDHLARHAELPDVVDLALPLVRAVLETELDSPLRWVSLDWDDTAAVLSVSELAADTPWPRPGPSGPPLRQIAHGVALADTAVVELRAAVASGPIAIQLPVVRLPESDIDPAPMVASPSPDTRDAFLVAAVGLLGADDPNMPSAEAAAAQLGVNIASSLGRDRRTEERPIREAAEDLIAFENSVGADFSLVEADDTTAVLANHRCPFGDAIYHAPSLCRVTSALAGRLAAESTGRDVSVILPERLGRGDHQCRLVLARGLLDNRVAHHYSATPTGVPRPEGEREAVFTAGPHVGLSLRLPRDELSVPFVRRLTRHALTEVGVVEEDRADVELALTEAATNVLDHAGPGDVYDVRVEINPTACEIRVVDIGRGFDHEHLDAVMPDTTAEEGRGVALMHALVDQVRFSSHPERGTIVHLVKQLHFDDTAPTRALMLDRLRRHAT